MFFSSSMSDGYDFEEWWSVETFSEDQGSGKTIHVFLFVDVVRRGVADAHQRRQDLTGNVHVRSARVALLALLQAAHPTQRRPDGTKHLRPGVAPSQPNRRSGSSRLAETQLRSKRWRLPGDDLEVEQKSTAACVPNVEAKAVTVALVSQNTFVMVDVVLMTASTNASTVE